MKITSETKIGISFVIVFALFLWGFNFLKGRNILRSTDSYYCSYDNIGKLTSASAVYISGHKVGQVRAINFLPQTANHLVIRFEINKDLQIPYGSIAKINENIMGTEIELLIYDTTAYHTPGDTLLSDRGSMMEIFTKEIEPVKRSAEELLNNLNLILDSSFRHNIAVTTYNLKESSALLSEKKEELHQSIDHLQSFMRSLDDNKEALHATITNFKEISESLNDSSLKNSLFQTTEALENILSSIEAGKGTAGKIIHDDSLYIHLNEASKNLSLLLEDLRENPKDYVRFSLFGSGKNKKEKQ